MSTPFRIRELQVEAWEAANNGRYLDAAMLHQQAYEIARRHGMLAVAFHVGKSAATCWAIGGRLDRELAIMLEILRDPPLDVDPGSLFHARGSMFEHFVYYTPNLEHALRLIGELESMAGADPSLPWADVPYLRSELCELRGQYAEALELIELSWIHHQADCYSKYQWAYYATRLNLRLGRRAAAGRWCDLLGLTNIDMAASRAAWHLMRGHLALWDRNAREAMERAIEAEDATVGLQAPEAEQRALELKIRATLLDPSRDDPQHESHPARSWMANRRLHRVQIDTRFEWELLRIDYRLATVRHAAGMAPAEDLWCAAPHAVTERAQVAGAHDLLERARHTRRAIARARRCAEDLDGRLGSDFRRREVDARARRLEEITCAVAG